MANGDQRISVSHETLRAELATLKLEIVEKLGDQEERTRSRFEQLRISIAGNPETFAGIKADVAELKDTVSDLQGNNRNWGIFASIAGVLSGVLTAIFGPK